MQIRFFNFRNHGRIYVFWSSCTNSLSGKWKLQSHFAWVQLQQPGIQPERVSGVSEKLRQPLIFIRLPVYFKLMILFYTFTKAWGQRFDIFSPIDPDLFSSKNHCCPSKGVPSSVLLLLFLMCPCEYTVIHVNVWAAYHIPQLFLIFLSPVCP